MSHNDHSKHPKLSRPDLGHFHRNEWAILGTPCGNIESLAFHLIEALSGKYKIGYVDADHKAADAPSADQAMSFGAAMEYTDKISHHRFDTKEKQDSFQQRTYFNSMDAVLVNGNHFSARKQIVFIDEKKLESLQRKTDRLTDISLVLLEGNMTEVPASVKEKMNEHTLVLRSEERDKITAYLHLLLLAAAPPVAGLVLAGGQSSRMGEDKGSIVYRDKPHREYLYDLLKRFCSDTFISCREDQLLALASYPTLPDSSLGLGPFGALLSAFRQKPDHAWLVLACDYPLMNEATIAQLFNNRNTSKVATAFKSVDLPGSMTGNDFPEPLVTIWEPRSYFELLRFLGQGYSCPRKVLINTDVELLDPLQPDCFRNVNTLEERNEVLALLKGG